MLSASPATAKPELMTDHSCSSCDRKIGIHPPQLASVIRASVHCDTDSMFAAERNRRSSRRDVSVVAPEGTVTRSIEKARRIVLVWSAAERHSNFRFLNEAGLPEVTWQSSRCYPLSYVRLYSRAQLQRLEVCMIQLPVNCD